MTSDQATLAVVVCHASGGTGSGGRCSSTTRAYSPCSTNRCAASCTCAASGGIAPIADVPKSLIKLYLDWAAGFHGLKSLEKIKGMEASAELRPPGQEQTDRSGGEKCPHRELPKRSH